jgi:hypothetical protein
MSCMIRSDVGWVLFMLTLLGPDAGRSGLLLDETGRRLGRNHGRGYRNELAELIYCSSKNLAFHRKLLRRAPLWTRVGPECGTQDFRDPFDLVRGEFDVHRDGEGALKEIP